MAHYLKNITTVSRRLRKLPFFTKAPIFFTNPTRVNPQHCSAASCWINCGFLDWGGFGYSTSSVEANGLAAMRLEDGGETHQEFLRWKNGGGIYHHLASIDPSSCIEVGAVVHSRAVLGADVHIGSGSVIGPGVAIGQSTKVGYNVALNNCMLGDFCIIHNGVCVGQDGFGFFIDAGFIMTGAFAHGAIFFIRDYNPEQNKDNVLARILDHKGGWENVEEASEYACEDWKPCGDWCKYMY